FYPVTLHLFLSTQFRTFDSSLSLHAAPPIFVLPDGYKPLWQQLCDEYRFAINHTIVYGGETRFHSVKNGLSLISDEETVCIHDRSEEHTSELQSRENLVCCLLCDK